MLNTTVTFKCELKVTLLVSHCNYSSILYHLRVIWRLIIQWP